MAAFVLSDSILIHAGRTLLGRNSSCRMSSISEEVKGKSLRQIIMSQTESVRCPLCGKLISESFPSPDFSTVRLAYCKSCGLGFPARALSDEELRQYYETGY